MEKTRVDIENDHINLYFEQQLSSISAAAKENLPKDISFKLFRKGGKAHTRSTSKINFLTKLYVLAKSLKKIWFLVILDEENGRTPEEFMELVEATKRKKKALAEDTEDELLHGTFITGNRELVETFEYINGLNNSPVYSYLQKAKNNIKGQSSETTMHRARMIAIVKIFAKYESNKKRIVSEMGITIPEWLVLMYLYHGKEEVGANMYNDFYKRAYQSSPTKIKSSFGTLQHRGYIQKTGTGRGAKMKITPIGIETVNTIMEKYALNY